MHMHVYGTYHNRDSHCFHLPIGDDDDIVTCKICVQEYLTVQFCF